MDALPYSQGEDSEIVQVVYGDEDEVKYVEDSQDDRNSLERRRRFAYDPGMRTGGRNGSLLVGSDSPRSLPHLQHHHALADQLHSLANNIAGAGSDDRRSFQEAGESPGFVSPLRQSPMASTSPQPPHQQSPAAYLTAASQSLAPRGAAAGAAANHPATGIALQNSMAVDDDLIQAFESNHRPVTSPTATRYNPPRGGYTRGRGTATLSTPGIRGSGGGTRHNPYASLLGGSSGGGSGRGRGRQATPRTVRGRGVGGRGNERPQSRFRQPQLGTDTGTGTPGLHPTGFHRTHIPHPVGEAILSSGDEEEEERGAQMDAAAGGAAGIQNTVNTAHGATPIGGGHQRFLHNQTPNPGSAGGSTGGTIQRDFLATLAPPPSRTTLSRGGRCGRAGGLSGRLHSTLSREKAVATAHGRNRGIGIRLNIVQKHVQAQVPRCHCTCDARDVISYTGVGVSEVVAVLSARSALDVDMRPGSAIMVYPPYRMTQNPDCADVPLMMCCGDVSQGA